MTAINEVFHHPDAILDFKYIRSIGVNRDLDPIYDGVVDPKIYAETKPRIAWVLKEPYDDFDEQIRRRS